MRRSYLFYNDCVWVNSRWDETVYKFHTKIPFHSTVCHDFDPWFGQVQGHWKEECKMCVWSTMYDLFLGRILESVYFKQRLLMTLVCVMILTQGHLRKFKLIGKKTYIIYVFYIPVPFFWKNIRSSFLHRDCLWSEGVLWTVCVMNLTHAQLCKFKVIVLKKMHHGKSFLDYIL